MKRDFLIELGIDEDVVNKIMAEHGKTTQRLKDKVNATQTEIEQLRDDLKASTDRVKEFEKVDVEALKKDAQDWKEKYENFERDSLVNEFFNGYKFTSELAKKAAIEEFKAQEFKVKDGKFDGADKYMDEFIKANEGAFVIDKGDDKGGSGSDTDVTMQTTSTNASAPYSYTPSGSSGTDNDPFMVGLSEIFKD